MAERNVVWTRIADIQFVGVLQYWVKREEQIKVLIFTHSQPAPSIDFNTEAVNKLTTENTMAAQRTQKTWWSQCLLCDHGG